MSLYSLSGKIANYVTEGAELDHSQTDRVRYGMEIILGALIKGTALLSTAYLLGILPQVMIALVCGSLLRLVSGGAHCTSYLRCLSFGLVIYLSSGTIALYLEKVLSHSHLELILLTCYLLMVLSAYLWAPAEVPYRTINSHEAIFFKRIAMALLTVSLVVSLLLANHIRLSFTLAGLLALLAQAFSFTPPGYKVIGKIDTFLFTITAKKGGDLNNAEKN